MRYIEQSDDVEGLLDPEPRVRAVCTRGGEEDECEASRIDVKTAEEITGGKATLRDLDEPEARGNSSDFNGNKVGRNKVLTTTEAGMYLLIV